MFKAFPFVFSNMFNSIMSAGEIIDNIVDGVLNSEIVNDMVSSLESLLDIELNMSEDEKFYVIESSALRVSKDDIIVDYENNYVTIEIKRNFHYSNDKNFKVAIVDNSDSFSKDFFVKDVDYNNIHAVYKDNILKVILPKNQKDNKIIEVNDFLEVDYIEIN